MNKITILLSAALMTTLSFNVANAQELKLCSTSEMMAKYFEEHPSFKAQYLAEEAALEQADLEAFKTGYKEGDGKAMLPIYTIPVVFHILHEGGPENISDAQIYDQVRILNEDYRKMNADISAVVPSFTIFVSAE